MEKLLKIRKAKRKINFNNTSSASDSYLWDFGNGDTSTVNFDTTIVYSQPGTYQVFLYVTDSICQLTDTAQITINVYDSLALTVNNDTSFCLPIPLTFTANSYGAADYFIWSSNSNFTDTLNTSISDSTFSFFADFSGYLYSKVGTQPRKNQHTCNRHFVQFAKRRKVVCRH